MLQWSLGATHKKGSQIDLNFLVIVSMLVNLRYLMNMEHSMDFAEPDMVSIEEEVMKVD